VKSLAFATIALSTLTITRCTKTTDTAGINVQIILNTNSVDRYQSSTLEFYLDELPGAAEPFTVQQLTPTYQPFGGVTYGVTVQDADSDGKNEYLFAVQQVLFIDTNSRTVPLLGNPLAQQFRVVARVKNGSGTVIGWGASDATNFASPAPTVTVNMCANGVCSGGDGAHGGLHARRPSQRGQFNELTRCHHLRTRCRRSRALPRATVSSARRRKG
jgi:hypothetical protein